MSEEVKTAGNWAKEFGMPEKKFKDAVKTAGVTADSKKGCCAYYSRKTAEKIKKCCN
ncbi:MAG: hypothetical protein HZB29_03035 [Nitrospinae bacterium]|nr:hypothetical protein [Nitrospinota bacterium]